MHSYLKSVGFSKITKREEMKKILWDVVNHYDKKIVVENHPDGVFAELSRNYGNDFGITVCGEYDSKDRFHVEYYYPYLRGTEITTQEQVSVERQTDKESFVGACDDVRIGITLIFFLQNPAEYMKKRYKGDVANLPLTFSGLACEGRILLPVMKDKDAVKVERESSKTRNCLMEAALNGDEDAMESLTIEDMDTYSMISERIVTEDIFSIVDSYFMPFGIQCDQYSVLGEIMELKSFHNIITGEEVVKMTIETNSMQFAVCINREDLLGEPQVGRRFRGIIWLQGQLQF